MSGIDNIKLNGSESSATYIVQNYSSGLTEEEVTEISEVFDDEVVDALIEVDYASLKFDPETLTENYDAILGALQTLDNSILATLFKPMFKKAVPNALQKATKYAKNEDELAQLIDLLKIKNYIR